ncbi:hypothetical protein WJX77_000604 [Trebouxia sp. C0004]
MVGPRVVELPQIQPYIKKEHTIMCKAIPVEQRVGVALYKLAHSPSYRQLSGPLAVSPSACQEICEEVFCMICCHLYPKYIKFPDEQELHNQMDSFNTYKGMPMCVGAVDGSHIPIKAPRHGAASYYNRKGFHSVGLQAAVNFSGAFIDTCTGFPGKAHDSRVYRNSSLSEDLGTGRVFPEYFRQLIEGVYVYPYLLGDAAYGLHVHLMKGYTGYGLSIDQEWFNTQLSSARMCVERAFGRLKGRWRILQVPCQFDNLLSICRMVTACCVLHNICEAANETYTKAWEETGTEQQMWKDDYRELADEEESLVETGPKEKIKILEVDQQACPHEAK